MNSISKLAVIYARISEDPKSDIVELVELDPRDRGQAEREGWGSAVRRQVKACREWAEQQEFVITKIYADNSISATNKKKRPAFLQMLEDKPPAIIVWHQDRLVRLTSDLELVINLDVDIHSVTSGILTLSSPQGRAVARTVAAWSTFEGEHKVERQDSAVTEFFERGEPIPGKRRFGFLEADKPAGRRVNIKAHPEEAPVVVRLFQDYLEGRSITSMAKELGWRNLRVRETLTNPAYAGYVRRRGEVRPAADYVDRIVSQEVYDAVQARLASNVGSHHIGGVIRHVASGIATCGVCGGKLSFRNSYLCLADLHHPSIKKEFLESKIREAVVSQMLFGGVQHDYSVDRIRAIEIELQEGVAAENRLAESIAGGLAPKAAQPILDTIRVKRNELSLERDELVAKSVQAQLLENLRSELRDPVTSRVSLAKAAQLRSIIRDRYDALEIEKKRELIRALPTIVLNPGRGPDRIVIGDENLDFAGEI